MKLEVVTIPVSDVDRAKEFYGRLGWRLDADFIKGDDRAIQFTPPGSQCSIHFGRNVTSAAPGSAQSLFLIVSDIQAAREDLVGRGVEVSEVFHFAGWNRVAPAARVSGPAPDRPATRRSCRSATRTATAGCCRRSRRGSPGRVDAAETTFASAADLAPRFGVRRPPTASTRSAPGQRDENWPDWYAAYMVAEQAGGELPQ